MIQYNFVKLGGTISEFNELTLGEILDFIYTSVDAIEKQNAELERQRKKTKNAPSQRSRSEKFTVGRDPSLPPIIRE